MEKKTANADVTICISPESKIENKSTGYGWCLNKNPLGKEQMIPNGAAGALRPGRVTFILGPSGAGKTTLLEVLAGRKKKEVTGFIFGEGRNAVLVGQHATLIDSLSARETLQFAANLKLPNASKQERGHAIVSVSKQMGIHEVLDVSAGRLSGGERKILTIACELLADPTIMLLDEPMSGLDTVSSMALARALRTVAEGGRIVACIIHKPSSTLFAAADDVILLARGRALYAGAVADVPAALSRAGFLCPQYYNIADFLLEVAMAQHAGNLEMLQREAADYAYVTKAIAINDVVNKNEWSLSSEALVSGRQSLNRGYPAGVCQQMYSLLWRGFTGVWRNVYLIMIRLVVHVLGALFLGALFSGDGMAAERVRANTSCLFFFLLFLFFSNIIPTIHTFPIESSMVIQEHLNRWYRLIIYCISKIMVDLPVQLLSTAVFIFPAWYLTSQPWEWERLELACLTCMLLTVLAHSFGLVVGAACDVKLGLLVISAVNIPMLIFSDFFISYKEIPVYLRPFADSSYFRYCFDALLETVYGFGRKKLDCRQVYCRFKNPEVYLEYLDLTTDTVTKDLWVLASWIGLLQVALFCILAIRVYRACK